MKFEALLLEMEVTTDWAGQLNEKTLPPLPPSCVPGVPAVDVPASRKYVPAAQYEQALAPLDEYVPDDVHAVQLVAPAEEYLEAAQFVHDAEDEDPVLVR